MSATDVTDGMRLERLAAFGEAWRDKDLDALVELMTDDAVYSASVGPEPGATFRGKEAVREGFRLMLAHDAATEPREGESWICGDRAVSTWSYAYTDPEGRPREIKGVDLWEFDGEKMTLKDAYRKTLPATPTP